jgi:hypothetical protein
MGAKRVSKQGVTVSEGNAIEVTNTSGTVLFSINNAGSINTLPNLTAKGSLITASGTSTPTTLAVGANDTVLTADSSTATGLKWATPAAGYTAPTIGSTTINSGATVTTISGLTLAAPTLTGTVTASGDINLTAVGAVGSINDEFALILMGAL